MRIRKLIAMLVAITLFVVTLSACYSYSLTASNLMKGVYAQSVDTVELDDSFIHSTTNLSMELFKRAFATEGNVMVSPTSILLALAMTTNGADANTLSQMEQVLGGGISIDQLNKYLFSFVNSLESQKKSRLKIANSIWFKEGGIEINPNFLQTNANYYGADAYAAAFDESTVADINKWADKNTEGMIKEILKEIPDEAIMYLINAVMFDAEWARIYNKGDIIINEFTAFGGNKQTAEFMGSDEYSLILDTQAKGFIKPYYKNKYSFVALLPDEGVSINNYVDSLTGERFLSMVENAQKTKVATKMPKFEFDFSVKLKDILKAMGMIDAFECSGANFSKMGSANGNIYISNVQHKTFISVNERGTRAGAVTSVENDATSAPGHYIILNRPFVFAIIDNATNLPIFTGTVLSI